MNFVPILVQKLPVKVFAFVLMSNHVHFVLSCSRRIAEEYINKFKSLYSRYYSIKYDSKELLRGIGLDFRELSTQDESFLRAVAYVQMNPVAANISINASDYPWGTGGCFFKTLKTNTKKVKDISGRTLIKMIHSKIPLPPQYEIEESGYISPSSYVSTAFVESIFRTPNRMNYFLRTSSKARLVCESPSFSDQVLISALKDLCTSLYKTTKFSFLGDAQKSQILKQMHFRFSADPNQLSRVCELPYDTVCTLMESF